MQGQRLGACSATTRTVGTLAGVARRAEQIADLGPERDAQLLVNAAWLHDLGYAQQLASTGFHPLDGARHVRDIGASSRLCGLVANHTASRFEAPLRGLEPVLMAEVPPEVGVLADALTYADLTVGPDGETVSVDERLRDIWSRYPEEHVVHRATRDTAPTLRETARRPMQASPS